MGGYVILNRNMRFTGPKKNFLAPDRVYEAILDIEFVSGEDAYPSVSIASLGDNDLWIDANPFTNIRPPSSERKRASGTRESFTARFSTLRLTGIRRVGDFQTVKKYAILGGIEQGGSNTIARVHSLAIRDVTEAVDARAQAEAAAMSATVASAGADAVGDAEARIAEEERLIAAIYEDAVDALAGSDFDFPSATGWSADEDGRPADKADLHHVRDDDDEDEADIFARLRACMGTLF